MHDDNKLKAVFLTTGLVAIASLVAIGWAGRSASFGTSVIVAVLLANLALFIWFHRRIRGEVRRAAAEAELHARQELNDIMDGSSAFVFVKDLQGRFITINAAMEKALGMSRQQVLGKTNFDLVNRDSAELYRQHDQQALQSNRLIQIEEMALLADGKQHVFLTNKFPLRDGSGQPYAIGAVAIDVTAMRQAQAEARLHDAALQSTAAAVVIADRNGTVQWANDAFAQLTGYAVAEAIGQNPRVLKSGRHEPEFYKNMWDTIIAGRVWRGELVNRRKDGSLYDEEMTINPVRDEGGAITHFIAIKQDITERKRIEEKLKSASAAKDHFLATLSHELRTPLTPVLATVSMLQEDQSLDPAVRQNLEVVRRNVELEARLIEDLLDLTRISRGKMQINPEIVDLHGLLSNVQGICLSDMQGKRITVTVRLDARRHHVRADPARLQQVFWNVLRNAAKFTPRHGSVQILTRDEPDGWCAIAISDSGIGMSNETLTRLFTPFEQGDLDSARQLGGLGLGMAISKALLDVQGGTIYASSDGAGRGATFVVALPTVDPVPIAADQAPAAIPPAGPGPSANVLVVEDHSDSARALALLLRRLGLNVQTADSVAAASALLAGQHFDLLISDIGLPDGTGIELVQSLRKSSNIPAIAVTGFGMEEDVSKCLNAGFNTHLTKPIAFQKLQSAVSRLLDGVGK